MIYNLDKPRNIKLGMRAMDKFEKETGTNIMSLDTEKMTIRQMAALIWAGLNVEMTVEDVMDLIDEHSSMLEASQAIEKAIKEAFPEEKPSKNAKKP
jgi:hypothetical protein